MVAIVAGNSLGLSLTSLATVGKDGTIGSSAGGGRSGEQIYVNSETGNLVLQSQDEYVAARGLDISGLRTYNSLGKMIGGTQDSWGVGPMRLKLAVPPSWGTGTMTRTDVDGAEAAYTWSGTDYITSAGSGAFDRIAKDIPNNQYIWTDGATQSKEYYDALGRLTQVREPATNATSNGTTVTIAAQSTITSVVKTDMAYNSFGEMTSRNVNGQTVAEYWEYDVAGRVWHTNAGDGAESGVDKIYEYDQLGRKTAEIRSAGIGGGDQNLAQGTTYTATTANTAINLRRTDYRYDNARQLKTQTSTRGQNISYSYDGLDRLTMISRSDQAYVAGAWVNPNIDIRGYDGAGHLLQTGGDPNIPANYLKALYGVDGNGNAIMGSGSQRKLTVYDVNGKVVRQNVSGVAPAYTLDNQTFDNAGNLTAYKVTQGSTVNSYTTTLTKFEGYKELSTSGTSSVFRPGTTNSHYDANGNLTSIDEPAANWNNRSFINDVNGQVLAVNQGGKVEREFIVNGEVLARYGSSVDPYGKRFWLNTVVFDDNTADWEFGYHSITPDYPSATPGQYTVQAGDTLRGIARSAYGDSDLWFEVASANGISTDSDLRVGMSLVVPNVVTSHNNVNTFVPYDPSKIVGSTTPYLAPPPPEDDVLGAIIEAIIVAVAAVWLGPQISAFISGSSCTAATLIAADVAGYAAAGAIGSAAGQGVTMAAGLRDKFSWTQVGLSAISAGVSAGLPSAAAMGNAAVRALVANTLTQGIGIATGLQRAFSWKAMIGSAVGASVGAALTPEGGFTDPGQRFMVGLVAGTAAAVVRGGKIAVQQVLADEFGNALGQGLVDQANQPSPQPLATQVGPQQVLRDWESESQQGKWDPDAPEGWGEGDKVLAANGFNMKSYGRAPASTSDPYAEFEKRRMQELVRDRLSGEIDASAQGYWDFGAKKVAIDQQPFNFDRSAERKDLVESLKQLERDERTWSSKRVDLMLQLKDVGGLDADQEFEMRQRQALGGLAFALGGISAIPLSGFGSRPTSRLSVTETVGGNTVTWQLNQQGYAYEVGGRLTESFKGAKRGWEETLYQSEAAARGIENDQGGHIAAHRFVLDQGMKNLFPQNANFNNSAFKTLENDYARYVGQGNTVDFTHTLIDFDAYGRPGALKASFDVRNSVGELVDSHMQIFKNEANQIYIRRAR